MRENIFSRILQLTHNSTQYYTVLGTQVSPLTVSATSVLVATLAIFKLGSKDVGKEEEEVVTEVMAEAVADWKVKE